MNKILLSGAKIYLPQGPDEVIEILSGAVYVYIAPLKNGRPARRCLLCEARAGETLPALYFADAEGEWRSLFLAKEQAEIRVSSGSSARELQQNFLQTHGLYEENVPFCDALTDFYRMRLVQEDGYLLRTQHEHEILHKKTDALVHFSETKAQNSRENAAYRALAVLSRRANLPIEPWQRVREACGDDASAAEIARFCGIPCREILLDSDWAQTDAGLLIVFMGENKIPAACLPHRRGYLLFQTDQNAPGSPRISGEKDVYTQRNIAPGAFSGEKGALVTKEMQKNIAPHALSLSRPLPAGRIDGRAFFRFCAGAVSRREAVWGALLCLLCALIALLPGVFARIFIDHTLPVGDFSGLWQMGALLCACMLGAIGFGITRDLCAENLRVRVENQAQIAVFQRVFALPEPFFAKYRTADLARRVLEGGVCARFGTDIAVSALYALVGCTAAFAYLSSVSPKIALICALICLISGVLHSFFARSRAQNGLAETQADAEADSALLQFVEAIEKLRTAGIEDRAVYESLRPMAQKNSVRARQSRLSGFSEALALLAGGLCAACVLLFSTKIPLSAGAFFAVCASAALLFGAIRALFSAISALWRLGPLWQRIAPILAEAPEKAQNRALPGEISGRIDVEHVHFSYDGVPVLRDLNLHVAPGEYLGVVGASGSGKSTLLKLLLGFESPDSGRIFYDSQDLQELSLPVLRKNFGVVLQEGSLISGTILENITLTRPEATLSEAEAACAAAGILSDILAMPMRFQTIVSEQSAALSGGQIQRILIARALIAKPKILFFDEATSALDNLSQKTVCDALAKIPATRIVVAHRLSTIRHCDRIIVLDDGAIAQEGTFDELMRRDGLFAKMASRQILD